ncbi:MAG: diguanylate cyclase [Sulfurimonadaceae bacterium]|jgi:diguanylate cyclase (GGDEF)-like protein|nr:diguanylate cyclase [Sulfurimonadaceae bacterium]
MQFFSSTSPKGKLLILIISIGVGLLSIALISVFNVKATKKNLDTLYFGSLLPVSELHEIVEIYHGTIASNIYRVKNEQISSSEAQAIMGDGIVKIEELWQTYQTHFKRDDELLYVGYTSLEIENTNGYLEALIAEEMDVDALASLSVLEVDEVISNIHNVLQQLIRYEMDLAQYERKKFLKEYNQRLISLAVGFGFVFLIVLGLIYYVFKAIVKDHHKLKSSSKKLKTVNKELENASHSDSLTGLYNRRYFEMVFPRELRRAKREEQPFTFMMLDVDYFKQYNDTYGHIAGDIALQNVAKTLQSLLKRPTDFVFRLGGEEFGILFTMLTKEESIALAQKLCESIEALEIQHCDSGVSEFVTLSLGAVWGYVGEKEIAEYIAVADKMLYLAKERGRNTYILEEYKEEIINEVQDDGNDEIKDENIEILHDNNEVQNDEK